MKTQRAIDNFWARVDKNDDCWLWTGPVDLDGYGRASSRHAHRQAWILLRGSIPEGLELDHLCNNRRRVRLEHLEAVTHLENVLRGVARRSKCSNGHPYTEANRAPQYGHHGTYCRDCKRIANRKSRQRVLARLSGAEQVAA